MLSVFICRGRDKLKILAVTSPLETCRLTDARLYMGFTPNTPQSHSQHRMWPPAWLAAAGTHYSSEASAYSQFAPVWYEQRKGSKFT